MPRKVGSVFQAERTVEAKVTVVTEWPCSRMRWGRQWQKHLERQGEFRLYKALWSLVTSWVLFQVWKETIWGFWAGQLANLIYILQSTFWLMYGIETPGGPGRKQGDQLESCYNSPAKRWWYLGPRWCSRCGGKWLLLRCSVEYCRFWFSPRSSLSNKDSSMRFVWEAILRSSWVGEWEKSDNRGKNANKYRVHQRTNNHCAWGLIPWAHLMAHSCSPRGRRELGYLSPSSHPSLIEDNS